MALYFCFLYSSNGLKSIAMKWFEATPLNTISGDC